MSIADIEAEERRMKRMRLQARAGMMLLAFHRLGDHEAQEILRIALDMIEWEEHTDEKRLELLGQYPCCRHCGSLNTPCYCGPEWDD